MEPELRLGTAFGNGYYRWETVIGSVFTHVLTALDVSKADFGKSWLVHATGTRFPIREDGFVETWFPCYVNQLTL